MRRERKRVPPSPSLGSLSLYLCLSLSLSLSFILFLSAVNARVLLLSLSSVQRREGIFANHESEDGLQSKEINAILHTYKPDNLFAI
jgi:hypothetical protein